MDLADEAFALATWPDYDRAFSAFARAERDAIRALVQAGYTRDAELEARVKKLIEKQRSELIEKYHTRASELLQQLGEITP